MIWAGWKIRWTMPWWATHWSTSARPTGGGAKMTRSCDWKPTSSASIREPSLRTGKYGWAVPNRKPAPRLGIVAMRVVGEVAEGGKVAGVVPEHWQCAARLLRGVEDRADQQLSQLVGNRVEEAGRGEAGDLGAVQVPIEHHPIVCL